MFYLLFVFCNILFLYCQLFFQIFFVFVLFFGGATDSLASISKHALFVRYLLKVLNNISLRESRN